MTDVELTLNAWETNLAATVFCVQGEQSSRTLRLTLIDRSGVQDVMSIAPVVSRPLDLTGYTPYLYVVKSDGTKSFFEGVIQDARAGRVDFTLTGQCVAAAGTAECTILLSKENAELKITGMTLDVQENDLEGALESQDEFNVLIALISQAQTAVSDCEKAADKANKAADNLGNQGQYAQTMGAYAAEQADKIAEAFPGLSDQIPATQLYQDFTVYGSYIYTKAGAFPLKSLKLCGPLAAGAYKITLRGKNAFNVNADHTTNTAYCTMTTVNDAVTVITKSTPAGFYDVLYSETLTLKPGASYTLSRLLTLSNTQGENTTRGDIRIGKADGTLIKFLPGETQDGSTRKNTMFNAPEDGKVKIALRYHNTGALPLAADVMITWAEIMLTETATASGYEPYKNKEETVELGSAVAKGEYLEIPGFAAYDGINVITNSAGAQMEVSFAAAVPALRQNTAMSLPTYTMLENSAYGWTVQAGNQPITCITLGSFGIIYGTPRMPMGEGSGAEIPSKIATMPVGGPVPLNTAYGYCRSVTGSGKTWDIHLQTNGTLSLSLNGQASDVDDVSLLLFFEIHPDKVAGEK